MKKKFVIKKVKKTQIAPKTKIVNIDQANAIDSPPVPKGKRKKTR